MGICWYCHWGWPKPVADIFLEAKAALNGDDYPLMYGPAHIVWADENFDSASWCLENFETYRRDMSDAAAAIVRCSLEQLAALPESVRNAEPEDYDDANPDFFPPPDGMEMIRI